MAPNTENLRALELRFETHIEDLLPLLDQEDFIRQIVDILQQSRMEGESYQEFMATTGRYIRRVWQEAITEAALTKLLEETRR